MRLMRVLVGLRVRSLLARPLVGLCTRLRGTFGIVALGLVGLGSPLVSIRLVARPPLLLQLASFRANQTAEDLPGVRSSLVLRASRDLARRDQVAQLQLRQVVGRRHTWIVQGW